MRECGLFIFKFDSRRSITIEILSRVKILSRRTANISFARLVFERRYFMVLRTFYGNFTPFPCFAQEYEAIKIVIVLLKSAATVLTTIEKKPFFSVLSLSVLSVLNLSAIYLRFLIDQPRLFLFEVKHSFEKKFFSTSKFPPFS